MSVEVVSFFHPASNTFSYLVVDPQGRQAAVIDPVLDYDPGSGKVDTASVRELMAHVRDHDLQVRWLLETHAHADHVSASRWLRQQWPQATLGIGAGITRVQATLAPRYALPADFRADGSQFDHLFDDGETFALGGYPARVIAVPGHTSDSVAYLIGDALFTGDSLFMPDGGSARCDFPGGDAAQLFRSVQRLFELPDATRVFICHDYGPGGRAVANQTTIGEQRRHNIHLHDGIGEAEFVATRQARDATLAEPRLMRPSIEANLQGGRTDVA